MKNAKSKNVIKNYLFTTIKKKMKNIVSSF